MVFSGADAKTAAASVSELLANDYDIIRESYMLERAGGCIRIDASEGKGGTGTPDLLQMVYIIPAADGCRIAAAHYTFESAEGFGARFRAMLNSLSVIDRQGVQRLSDEEALAAIRNYCRISNPDLESIAGSGEYPLYWDVAESTGSEITVLFRSYTGAQIRYHIDPFSGETYVTEFVPGITPEEERTGESFNVRDYFPGPDAS